MKDITELKEMLNGRIESVCKYLLPGGKRQYNEWRVADISGGTGKSMGVHLAGEKVGIWCDFASDTEKGDVIDLWRHARNVSLPDALAEIKQFLGLPEPIRPAHKRTFAKPASPKIQNIGDREKSWLLHDRNLTQEALDIYGVKAEKGMLYFPTYVKGSLVHWKEMPINKDLRSKLTKTSSGTRQSLFGWQAIPDNMRMIAITEGELDALAMFVYGYNAVSVPFGAKNLNWIDTDWELLEQYDLIYLCFDMDEPGQSAAKLAADRLGAHRCMIVKLPCKDANECLIQRVPHMEIDRALRNAKPIEHEDLKDALYFQSDVMQEFYPPDDFHPGFKLKFHPKFDNVHFLYGDLTIWSGFNGHGKTTMIQQMVLDAVSQGEAFCMASLEMLPRKYLKTMVKQATGKHLPSPDEINKVMEWFSGRLVVYDKQGKTSRAKMLEAFEYARKRYGVKNFVVDSLLKCGIAETDWDTQKLFAEELADFARDKGVHVHLVAHSRKLESESQKPDKLDIKGSGSITDVASNVLIHWRNKGKEQLAEKGECSDAPDAVLYVDKQRHEGWEGSIPFLFDRQSCQFYSTLTGVTIYFNETAQGVPF